MGSLGPWIIKEWWETWLDHQTLIISKSNQIITIHQNSTHQVYIHRGMCELIAVSACIHLLTKKGSHGRQKFLSGCIRIGTGYLSAACVSTTGSIITIFIIKINTIKVLILHNVYKGYGDLIIPAKAVIPAIVVISSPGSSHTCAAKTKNDRFPLIMPTVYQGLVIHAIVNGNCILNVALCITIVLGRRERVGDSKCNDNMGCVY